MLLGRRYSPKKHDQQAYPTQSLVLEGDSPFWALRPIFRMKDWSLFVDFEAYFEGLHTEPR